MLRLAPRIALVVAVLALFASPAFAQGVEILSGQKFTDEIEEPNDTKMYRFHAVKGDALTLALSAVKKSEIDPVVALIGPAGAVTLPASKKGKITLKKFPVPATGQYFLFIAGAGTTGEFAAALKIKGAKIAPAENNVPGEYKFTAPAGALVSATVKAAKGTDLEPGIDAFEGPLGDDQLDAAFLTEKGKSAKLKKHPVETFGEQTLVLAERAGTGNATVKIKVKAAKPAEKKLTAETLFDTAVLKGRIPDGEGGYGYILIAEAFGENLTAAKLIYPDGTELALKKNDDGDFDSDIEADDEADIPDGLYQVVVTRSGIAHTRQFVVGGPWPTDVEVTDEGTGATPTIMWTGGAGAQFIYLDVIEVNQDDTAYEMLFPGGTTSHTVPVGPLSAMSDYEVEVYAVTSGNKLTVNAEADGGGGGGGGGGSAIDVTSSGVNVDFYQVGHWRPQSYYTFHAELEGTGIRSALLRYPDGSTKALSQTGNTWSYEQVSAVGTDFKDGVYRFEIQGTDGSTDDTHVTTVGDFYPDWYAAPDYWDASGEGLLPRHLTGAGTANPTIQWPDLMWADGYGITIVNMAGDVVHTSSAFSNATSHAVPNGTLTANRWYTAEVTISGDFGKSTTLVSTFYAGSGIGELDFDFEKLRGSFNGGATVYARWAEVWQNGSPTNEIASGRYDHEDGTTELVLAYDQDEESWLNAIETPFDMESTLNTQMPDGWWTLTVSFQTGGDLQFKLWVGGEWPELFTLVAPADGATDVSRTPSFTWTSGATTNVDSVYISLYDADTDDEFGECWPRLPGDPAPDWDDFENKEVSSLPASTEVQAEVFSVNGHNKETISITSFTTTDPD